MKEFLVKKYRLDIGFKELDENFFWEFDSYARRNWGCGTEARQAILNDVHLVHNELEIISGDVKISNEKAKDVLLRLDFYGDKLREPTKNTVNYHHYLHKGLVVSVTLFIVSMLLLLGWVNSYNSNKQYEANDIKYRALKITAGQNLLKTLYNIDSLYNANPEVIRKKTIQEEERIAEQIKLLRLAGEKEKEAKELKRKAKGQ